MVQPFFTRPLRQRSLLPWTGGVYYSFSDPGSIDFLELARTKYHELEKNPARHTLILDFCRGLFARLTKNIGSWTARQRTWLALRRRITLPKLPPLSPTAGEQGECVRCKSLLHTSYECDAYRQKVQQVLEYNRRFHRASCRMQLNQGHVLDRCFQHKGCPRMIHCTVTGEYRTNFHALDLLQEIAAWDR